MSQSPAGIDRRTLLQRVGLTALIAGPGATLLSACATSSSKKSSGVKGNGSATNPFGVKANAPLDVVIFMGGYKDGYATQGHEPLYKKAFPTAQIKHEAIT